MVHVSIGPCFRRLGWTWGKLIDMWTFLLFWTWHHSVLPLARYRSRLSTSTNTGNIRFRTIHLCYWFCFHLCGRTLDQGSVCCTVCMALWNTADRCEGGTTPHMWRSAHPHVELNSGETSQVQGFCPPEFSSHPQCDFFTASDEKPGKHVCKQSILCIPLLDPQSLQPWRCGLFGEGQAVLFGVDV